MKNKLLPVAMFLLALCLASCASPKRDKSLDETLLNYEQMVRWSEWDGAANMVAPEYQLEHPITNLDMERLRLFKVTQYVIRSATPYDEGNGFRQSVEIRAYNKARATEKVVMDHQDWKYDEERQVWLLHSGLPDVSKRY